MKKFLFLALACLSITAFGQRSLVPATMVSYTNSVLSVAPGYPLLSSKLGWIDTNWPTNIDITKVYIDEDRLAYYDYANHSELAHVSNMVVGVSNMVVAYTNAATIATSNALAIKLDGTNMVGATYNSTTKVWTVSSIIQPDGVLVDYLSVTNSISSVQHYRTATTTSVGTFDEPRTNGWVVAQDANFGGASINSNGILFIVTNRLAIVTVSGDSRFKHFGTNAQPTVQAVLFERNFEGSTTNLMTPVVASASWEDGDYSGYDSSTATFVIETLAEPRRFYTGGRFTFGVSGVGSNAFVVGFSSIKCLVFTKP